MVDIREVMTIEEAAEAHRLILMLCEELNYKDRPGQEDFVKSVMQHADDVAVLVAWDGKQAVGTATLTRDYWAYNAGVTGFFKSLYVLKDWRKKGVTESLFKEVRRQAKRRGYKMLWWMVDEKNAPSAGFFRRMGLSPDAERWMSFTLAEQDI